MASTHFFVMMPIPSLRSTFPMQSLSWLFFLLFASSSLQAADFAPTPAYHEGDYWLLREADGYTHREINQSRYEYQSKQAEYLRFNQRTIKDGKSSDSDFFTSENLNPFFDGKDEDSIEEYDVLHFPITTGESHTFQYSSPNRNTPLEALVTVGDWETVKVPAGEFRAIAIHVSGMWYNDATVRGKWTETYWYAPAAKWIVKRESKDYYSKNGAMTTQVANWTVEELSEFKLH